MIWILILMLEQYHDLVLKIKLDLEIDPDLELGRLRFERGVRTAGAPRNT